MVIFKYQYLRFMEKRNLLRNYSAGYSISFAYVGLFCPEGVNNTYLAYCVRNLVGPSRLRVDSVCVSYSHIICEDYRIFVQGHVSKGSIWQERIRVTPTVHLDFNSKRNKACCQVRPLHSVPNIIARPIHSPHIQEPRNQQYFVTLALTTKWARHPLCLHFYPPSCRVCAEGQWMIWAREILFVMMIQVSRS